MPGCTKSVAWGIVRHDITMATVDRTSYANLILLQRRYAQLENRCWMRSRKNFLAEELQKHGTLTCHYCGRTNLKLKSKRRCEQATVDHVVAKSNGGDPYDRENFAVCCASCNKKKASKTADDFINSKYLKTKIKSRPNHANDGDISQPACG